GVVQENIENDDARAGLLDAFDQLRQLSARPGPLADFDDAVLIDRNNQHGTGRTNRSCKPERKVIGDGIELLEVVEEPEEQQNRRSRKNTRGQWQEALHRTRIIQ